MLPLYKLEETQNYYAFYMEKLGFTKQAWIVFTFASFLQTIWGCEACFIAINIDFLGKHKDISQQTISICVCLLYSMMGIGSAFVGVSTKYIGRIPTLQLTTMLYILSTSACSLLPSMNFYIIIILRCLGNIAIGVFNIVGLNLMSEFFPIRNRCLVLMINSGFYNLGNLFTLMLNNWLLNLLKFEAMKWRLINFVTTIPGFLGMLLLVIWCTESPLFLLNQDKDTEGFKVIEVMAQTTLSETEKLNIKNSIKLKKNYQLKSNYRELFTKDYLLLTICSLMICSICYLNMIGISYLIPKTILSSDEEFNVIRYNTQIIIYGLIQLPNGFIGGFMTESFIFGRKRTIWISVLVCSIFCFISSFWPRHVAIYAGIIMLFNSISFGGGFIYVTEVFPTKLRDQAQSFIQFFSFILGSWSPFVVDYFSYYISYIILGVTNIVCIGFTLYLPVETILRPLDEDVS